MVITELLPPAGGACRPPHPILRGSAGPCDGDWCVRAASLPPLARNRMLARRAAPSPRSVPRSESPASAAGRPAQIARPRRFLVGREIARQCRLFYDHLREAISIASRVPYLQHARGDFSFGEESSPSMRRSPKAANARWGPSRSFWAGRSAAFEGRLRGVSHQGLRRRHGAGRSLPRLHLPQPRRPCRCRPGPGQVRWLRASC